MKRDWEVIRVILTHIENNTFSQWIESDPTEPEIRDYTDQKAVILGHLELLIDADIVRHAEVTRDKTGQFSFWDFRGIHLTMQGHDFLDALRDATIWNRIKAMAVKNSVHLSWEFIRAALPIVITSLL